MNILKKKVGIFKREKEEENVKNDGVLDNGLNEAINKNKIYEDKKKEFNSIVVDKFLNNKNRFYKKQPLEKNLY